MNEILNQEKSIYIQIKEMIENDILRDVLLEEERVPSTNELARLYAINPATAAKGINLLVDANILYKKRGIGMFVAEGAKKRIMKKRREEFYDNYVRTLIAEAVSIGISKQELIDMINESEDGGNNLEAAMGCTRKDFFLSYYLTGFLVNIVYVILLAVICMAENSIGKILYPDMINVIDLLSCIIRWGIPAAVALTVIGGFCGTLVLRFGKKAFWVMWAIWMIVCLGGPRAAEAVSESPDSLFGKMGLAIEMLVERVPLNLWILLAIVLVLACGIGNYLMIRRQQVSL